MLLQKTRLQRLDLLGLLVILGAAAILRIGFVGVAEYRKDEAQLTSINLALRQGTAFPFVGIPSSIGIPNSPMTVYLLMPPFLIFTSPLAAIVYIGLLNVIGVGILWLIAYRYLGSMVAFVAGLAYAVNPWAVLYSRKIWAQDYHTPFILLAIFLGLYGFVDKKRWAQILCLPVLLIGLQIHFAAWTLLPLYLILLWNGRRNTSWRVLGISAVLSVLVLVPYGIGLIQARGQYSTTFPTGWYPALVEQPVRQLSNLTTGLELQGTYARDQADDFLAQVPQPASLWNITVVFLLVGAVILWWKSQRYLALMITLWAFITVVVITIIEALGNTTAIWFESWPHYYIPSIPALCLLIGLGVSALGRWRQAALLRVIDAVVGTVAALIFITQFVAVVGLLRYVDTHVTTSGFSFGTPLHYLLPIRDVLRPYSDVVIINGDGRDLPNTGAPIWRSLLPDANRCIRDVALIDTVAVFPARPFAALFMPTQSGDDLSPLKAIYQTANPTIDLIQGQEAAQIYPLQNLHWTGSPITQHDPIPFTNGLTLIGYHREAKKLTLMWTLPSETKTNYATVVSYLAADNRVLGQHAEPFWESSNWCINDTLVDWMDIDPPAETTHLSIGLESANRDHAPVTTQAGEPTIVIPIG